MKEIFVPKISTYDFHNYNLFQKRRLNSVWHSTESVCYLGPKIWHLVLNEIKQSEALNAIKFRMKRWVPYECP